MGNHWDSDVGTKYWNVQMKQTIICDSYINLNKDDPFKNEALGAALLVYIYFRYNNIKTYVKFNNWSKLNSI